MSWLLGLKRKKSSIAVNTGVLRDIAPSKPLFIIDTQDMYLLAGGLKETCLSSTSISSEKADKGWIICGLGILKDNEEFSYMYENDWNSIISVERFNNVDLNGHFALVKWSKNQIDLYNDLLGIRRLYVMEDEQYFYFSTRLDWLVKCKKNCKVSFENLSSFWNLQNSFTYDCFIKGITRLNPGAHARITDHLSVFENDWIPSLENYKNLDIHTVLKNLTLLPIKHNKQVVLSLSGGIDCRTILSYLCNKPKDKWTAYTIEEEKHPDYIIAKKMSDIFSFNHTTLNPQNTDVSYQHDMCKEFSLHMEMTYPLYSLNYLKPLTDFYRNNYWMISGGFGEYMRRVYGNNLLHYGKKHLKNKNIKGIIKYFKDSRAPIFNHDVLNVFEKHSFLHLEQAIHNYPINDDIDIENWLDVLLLKYRLTNCPANATGFFDTYIPNYMPLCQPMVINYLLSIPSSKRTHNKISRDIIRLSENKLSQFPLVRDNIITPYFTSKNNYFSKIWALVKKKFGYEFRLTYPVILLKHLKEPVYDRMLSSRVQSYSPYNYPFIKKIVIDFYENDATENWPAVYNWLAFDMWREIL